MKLQKSLLLISMIIANRLCYGQIRSFTLLTKQPKQYDKSEWNILLTGNFSNPYLAQEIALDMLITSPRGKILILPCYFEQGQSGKLSLWKARFAPQEKGIYDYKFRLSNAAGISGTSKNGSFNVIRSNKNGFLHTGDNWTLEFDNGKRFRGIGENIAWESRTSDDSKYLKKLHQQSKYSYEYMLRSLAKHGGNFYRTWICPWNLALDWHKDFNNSRYTPSDAYFNPSAIKKMDRLITLSDSLHVYMMLTLGMGNYKTADGGFSPNDADFFVNPRSVERYKNRLRYIVARWGYSNSIAAWELFNEVDNVQFADKNKTINADSIVAWHKTISAYLKLLDPYAHVVTTSISHRDLQGLNAIKSIDINQKHIYKNTAGIPAAIVKYETDFKKPYVIGEYGYEWDWSKNFDDFAPEMDNDFKRGLWFGLFSPTPVLPMSWWWEYFDSRRTDAYLSKINYISNLMLNNHAPFQSLEASSTIPKATVLALQTGKEIFLYINNNSSQLYNGDITVNDRSTKNSTRYSVTHFTCEDGNSVKMPAIISKNGLINITTLQTNPKSSDIYILKQL